MSNITIETKLINAKVNSQSLIGTSRERPVSRGNYFWVKEGRVMNMWAENLEHLVKTKVLKDGKVEVIIYTDTENDHSWVLVIDSRVPEDYLYNKLCFTGFYRPPIEVAEHVFSIIGDPNNEIELWTDPVTYYKKRGLDYNPETGLMTTRVSARPTTIDGKKFTMKVSDGGVAYYTPYIPGEIIE